MGNESALLGLTAATVGVLHAVLGPDHYLPFVLLARVERWSRVKTVWVTLACGLGHVLSSLALGMGGIALGLAMGQLEVIETIRGRWAAWILMAFGLAYCLWGLRRAARNQPHTHVHAHAGGVAHIHRHVHQEEHVHIHREHASQDSRPESWRVTPWVLFILFVFGPCEPLIPLLMYPAAQGRFREVAVVTVTFCLTTLGTMLILVMGALHGIERLPLASLERYTHALAGAAIALCGIAIAFFGL